MKKSTLSIVVISSALVILLSAFSLLKTESATIAVAEKHSFENSYHIHSVKISKDLTFCGEEVPLHNFDVFESLDREIHVNTYWQSQTLIFIKKANRYFPVIEPVLKEYGVPDDMKYLAVAESGLANVVSPAGAKGYWQFLKATAKEYGLEVNSEVDERYHLEKATVAAAQYLKKAYEKFGSWPMAAAAYNMGRSNLIKQVDRQKTNSYYDLVLGDETGRYVYRILALKTVLESPQDYGFYVDNSDKYPVIDYKTVVVDSAIYDLAAFAKSQGVNYKILKELNPWLRDNKLQNKLNKTYEIKIADTKHRTY